MPARLTTRDRILRAALDAVREGGVEAVSVRSIAHRIGVTPMAVYKHFEDKAALIAAVIWAGFERWETYMARALEERSARAIVWKAACEYREFAIDEPRLFELMFLMPREDAPHVSYSVSFNERPVFAGIVRAAAALSIGGSLPGEPPEAVLALWSTLHGLCTLNSSGRFGKDLNAYRRLYEKIVLLSFPGLEV